MKNIKVLYDYQTFHIQRFGGISRYFCEIINRMHGVYSDVSISFSMNKYLDTIDNVHYVQIPSRLFKLSEGLFRWLNKKRSLRDIRKKKFDIFHPTYYSPYFINALNGMPFVLTIHDMTHERCPEFFAPDDPTVKNKKLLAEKADRIIAISENTKRDIIDILHIDEKKIDVVYHGFQARKSTEIYIPELPCKYILYVGERRAYKNFEVLLSAFVKLHKEMPDLYIVLTGRPLSKSEKATFTELCVEDRIKCYSNVSDEMLDGLYKYATLFVYPSLYEGFGLPILEAFAQKCPVVLSNASCFPEIGGDACAYFSPKSVMDLYIIIQRIIKDEEYRNSLISKGTRRLTLFDWETTASQTEAVYTKVIG